MDHLQRRRSQNKSRKAVVVLPTGTGKTGIALLLPYALRCKRALVVTPRDTLRSQMYEAATYSHTRPDEWPFLQTLEIIPADHKYDYMLGHVRLANKPQPLFDDISSVSMTVANAMIFTDRRKQSRKSWTYDLVIVDEAHNHPAQTWKIICEHFLTNPACNVIFLTATPYRRDGADVCTKDEFCYQLRRSEAVQRTIIRNIDSVRISYTEEDKKRIVDAESHYAMDDSEDEQTEESEETEETEDEENKDEEGYSSDDNYGDIMNQVLHEKDFDADLHSDMWDERVDRKEHRIKNISVFREVRRLLLYHDQHYPLPNGRKHKGLIMVNSPSKVAHQLELNAKILFPDMHARGYFTGPDVKKRKLSKRQREVIFNSFKRRNANEERETDPRILIVNNMLREGFDFASVSVIGISRSFDGDGPTFEQFLGRAVRRFRVGEPPGLTAKFVWHSHDMLTEPFQKYLTDRPVQIVNQY